MAAAALTVLGPRVSHGLVVYKDFDPHEPRDPRLTYHAAGHPVPDARSCAAGAAALALLAAARAEDLVLVLLSGGGSALLVDLAPGISLPMLQALTRRLLACGADITAINTVRRRIDRVKGGGLARAGAHTTLRTVILSDVIGNSLTAIASGPTVPNPDDDDAARQVLLTAGIDQQVDPAILAACGTPITRQPVALTPIIIADISQSLAAAGVVTCVATGSVDGMSGIVTLHARKPVALADHFQTTGEKSNASGSRLRQIKAYSIKTKHATATPLNKQCTSQRPLKNSGLNPLKMAPKTA
jgi:glycerate-2-kinase